MQANKHEIEQALAKGIAIRGGLVPVAVLRDAGGRATALRVARCEARMVGGRLEIKTIEGTEEDIEADLIVSAIGQAVDFTGLESLNNGKGGISADRNYQVQGQPGMFVGGDVVRPHLLTTAIGHGAIAADGIDRHPEGEPLDKRPKIDVHSFDLMRKIVEKELPVARIARTAARHRREPRAIHNYDNRSDRYVIPHTELFLGHFSYTPRNRRKIVTLTRKRRSATSRNGGAAAGGPGPGRGQALHELRAVLRVRQTASIYCPQTAVFKVSKAKSTTGATSTPTTPSASAATSARTSAPPATSRWAWGIGRCAVASRSCRCCWRGLPVPPRERPHAAAGDRARRRRARSASADPATHAPHPHGPAQAPARRHRARRHPRREAQPEGLHRLPRRTARRAAWPGARRLLRQLPQLRGREDRLLRVPRCAPATARGCGWSRSASVSERPGVRAGPGAERQPRAASWASPPPAWPADAGARHPPDRDRAGHRRPRSARTPACAGAC